MNGKYRLPRVAGLAVAAVLAGGAIAAPARAETDGDSPGEPIIVTAQMRSQPLEDVPITVRVIDAATIDMHAADDMARLAAFVPGLAIDASSPTQPRIAIRGITTTDFGIGTDPAVGVYVDGVYAGRSGGEITQFNDIEHIEVLKGPQGTLLGRNSAAGGISIITRKPVDHFEAETMVRAGNYGKVRVDGMVNVPLTSTLALRVSGVFNRRDGLYTDAATGQRRNRQLNWSGRAQLRWRPDTETDVLLTWFHDQVDQDARPSIRVVPLSSRTPAVGAPASTWIDPLRTPITNDVSDNPERRNLNEVSLHLERRMGAVTLSAITDWRHFSTFNREDEDSTNRADLYLDSSNAERNTTFYQELRLSGASHLVDWVAGASFNDEKAGQVSGVGLTTDSIDTILSNIGQGTPFHDLQTGLIDAYGLPISVLGQSWDEAMINHGHYQAWAAFGDAIWHVTPRLNLTTGLRYTRDIKHFSWFNGSRSAPGLDAAMATLNSLGALALAGVSPSAFAFDVIFDMSAYASIPCENGVTVAENVTCKRSARYGNLSPRAVLDYRIAPGVLLFAGFSRGYKAGGFTATQPGSTFRNELVDNYEAGIKADLRKLGLVMNLSGFHYVYNNRQTLRLETPAGSLVSQYVTDTSDEQAWGADFDTNWTPRALPVSLYAQGQYIDATYRRRVNTSGQDLAGQPTGTPMWSVAGGARLTRPLGRWGLFAMDVSHAYTSVCRTNAETLAQGFCGGNVGAFVLNGARNRTDLKIAATRADGGLSFGFFVQNLFDNRYVQRVSMISASALGTPYAVLTNPRFFGGEIKVHF
ncbi:TonB-dependent receptor, plug [Novosphingobium nitrogenifigens DSM 19370]|uniref:TonB-dependent receptor, plug n=2 Tax=Novosphingobium nitrogenifigens TaxID=378548 RepID=F1Z7I3_9SPHN|nr:TonB-dependent receptor, plug [Novosphingobium nitrogenifigens DSM 19370]